MIKNSLLVAWIFLTFTATGVIWLGQHNPDLLEKISLGLIPHNLGSDKEIKFESTIDKEVFIWSSIYKPLSPNFTWRKISEDLFDGKPDMLDFETDYYYVAKMKNYCLANFLFYVLNTENYKVPKNYLFMDYSPKSALKYKLQKQYKVVNRHFTQKSPTINLLENRKKYYWNPKIKVYWTKKPLYFNTEIGECYYCLFQASNHAPGEGRLSRQDLLTEILTLNTREANKKYTFDGKDFIDFFPTTYRLNDWNECKTFFNLAQTEEYKFGLLGVPSYIRKVIVESYETKIDAFEDRKLRSIYMNGALCGKRKELELAQINIRDVLKLPSGARFKYRAFLYIANFDPLVAFFKHGYIMKERENDSISFKESIIPLEKFMKILKEEKLKSSWVDPDLEERIEYDPTLFKSKTLPLVEDSMRKSLFAFKDKPFKDNRGYQIFAFNFVIDSSFKPWLTSVTAAPYFTGRNSDILESVLDHQFQLVNARNHELVNYLKKLKYTIDQRHFKQNFQIRSEEHFLKDIYHHFDFTSIAKNTSEIMKHFPMKEHPSNFEMFYDGRILSDVPSHLGVEKERFLGKLDTSKLADRNNIDL